MEVRESVAKARNFLAGVFADEVVSEIRLEEVEYDKQDHTWYVTFSFLREDGGKEGQLTEISAYRMPPLHRYKRIYKVVGIPENEQGFPSIKIREFSNE